MDPFRSILQSALDIGTEGRMVNHFLKPQAVEQGYTRYPIFWEGPYPAMPLGVLASHHSSKILIRCNSTDEPVGMVKKGMKMDYWRYKMPEGLLGR